eukprot:14296874-Ditylum_brightwellii.AAC.1
MRATDAAGKDRPPIWRGTIEQMGLLYPTRISPCQTRASGWHRNKLHLKTKPNQAAAAGSGSEEVRLSQNGQDQLAKEDNDLHQRMGIGNVMGQAGGERQGQ